MKTTTEKNVVEAKKPLTMEEIEAKAKDLSEQYKNTVTPIVVMMDGEQVVGYFQEPEYDILMYAVDCYVEKKISLSAEATFKNCFLAAESDQRIIKEERRYAKLKASFTNSCLKMVVPYVDEYKKKLTPPLIK